MSNTYDPNYIRPKNFYLIGVKTLVFDQAGNILLLRRSQLSTRPGGWDFPGGAMDKSENPINAVIRETIEETGLELEIDSIIPIHFELTHDENDDCLIIGFQAKTNQSAVNLSWEHDEYHWLTRDQVSQYSLPPLLASILSKSI
jgi:8-oxo-dGTP diphosphatase